MNKRHKKKLIEYHNKCPICHGFIYCTRWGLTSCKMEEHFCEHDHHFVRERNNYINVTGMNYYG